MRRAARLSLLVAAVATLAGLTAGSLLERHQLPILIVGFAVGLPHGAVDHLVPFWTGWVRRGTGRMASMLLGYVVVAGVAWIGLRWAGAVVLPVLLVVSVLHFGAGDLGADHDDGSPARPIRPVGPGLVAAVLARGGPVVVGPLLFWPQITTTALVALRPGFVLPSFALRVLAAAVVVACGAVAAVGSIRLGDGWSAAELVVLAALFTVVPPLAAFGVYFGAWHGLRHTARLIVRDPRNRIDLAAGRVGRPLRRFMIAAAIPTLVAAGSSGVIALAVHQDESLQSSLFTVLLALTVPHLVVVAALDISKAHRAPKFTSEPVASRLATVRRR